MHGVAWMIAGTAGEGLESGGEAFARALAAAGYRPTTQRDFPSRIRGGDTTFTVRLTPEGHLCPPLAIDLALAFNETVLPRIVARLHPESLLLVDEGVAHPDAPCEVVAVAFTQLAKQAGAERSKNVVALGASARLLGIDLAVLEASVDEQFGAKGEAVRKANQAALRAGFDAVEGPRFKAPKGPGGPALWLSGNEAAAFGALVAGCRVAAAYPITPASDVLEYLMPRLQVLGGTALQMEDELAALNVLVGAGYAGAKALTATSGPGLSLMTEAIGLAASAETPCVILDCQRPGPSTGMPTKHGQEDLWHLVHGGHGEAVRVVLAPTDVGDAFHTTSEAFRIAERFRCPVLVAMDQQMSLFKQVAAPFDVDAEASRHGVRPPAPEPGNAWEGTYLPYGDDGGPARVSIPGEAARYYSNSTEHAPSGFTTEDPGTRNAMVQRRLRRLGRITRAVERPVVVEGEPADVVLVAFGSTVEACREARVRLAGQGVASRVVALRLLWPFPKQAFLGAVGEARVFVAEANAFGQLARLIRSEVPIHGRLTSVRRYDGLPMPSDRILDAVNGKLQDDVDAWQDDPGGEAA